MEAKSRNLFAVAVLLLGATAFLWSLSGRGNNIAPAPAAEAPPTVADAPPAVASEAAMAKVAAPAAEAPAVATPAAELQRTEAPAAAKTTAILRGRCVDAAGAPLADCKLRLHAWECNSERMDAWLRDHADKPDWKDPDAVTTGSDGRFSFTFWPPPPYQFALDVTRDGCGQMGGRWSKLTAGSDTDVGDVAMVAGVRVTGRVVDGEGVPQAKEYVTLQRRDSGSSDDEKVGPRWGDQVVSKPDGTFLSHGWLPPGEYELSTQQLLLQSPKTLTLTAERPTEELTVVVAKPPAQTTIRGRVLDETGAPARGVTIEDRADDGGWGGDALSGRDGAFELRQQPTSKSKTAKLSLVADAYDIDEKASREVPWGTTDVEFRVVRAAALTLRVTDERQAPVETYTVRLVPQKRSRWSSNDSRARAQGKHEDGTVVVTGLNRGDWLVLVDFPSASGLDSLFVPFQQDGGPKRLDLRAVPSARRTLRVVAADDAPVAGTNVQLCDPLGSPLDDNRMVMRRDHWLMNSGGNHALVLFEGTTDSDGRLELRGPGDRELAVCVPGPGHVPLRQASIRLDAKDEIVVRVSRGARFVGKIVPPEALAELKRLAGAEPNGPFPESYRPKLTFVNAQGQRFPKDHVTASNLASLRIADDGSFDAAGLPPGFWKVEVKGMVITRGGSGHSKAFPAGEVNLTDGATTTQDLDLGYVLPGTIDGLVLLNGEPFANGNVALHREGNDDSATTDGEGRFLKSLFAGDYVLQVAKNLPSHGWVNVPCPTPVRVVRGQTTTQTFTVTSATLQVTVLDAVGKPVPKVSLQALGSEKNGNHLQPTDDAGTTGTELAPGTVTLRVLPKALTGPEAQQKLWREAQARGDSDPFGPHWITLQTMVLAAGQTSAVEVRLPAAAGY